MKEEIRHIDHQKKDRDEARERELRLFCILFRHVEDGWEKETHH